MKCKTVDKTAFALLPLVLGCSGESATAGIQLVASAVACETCQITLTLVTTIGGRPDDEVSADLGARVSVDSKGTFYVAPTYTPHQFGVYSSDSDQFRGFGKKGQGPGEFSAVRRVFVDGADSVHVIEYDNRYTVFSPGLTDFVRLKRLPFYPLELRMLAGVGIVAFYTEPGKPIGTPLYTISPDGDEIGSFGAVGQEQETIVDQPTIGFRQYGPGASGTVWSVRANRYELEKWDTSGARLIQLERQAKWFEPRSDGHIPSSFTETRPVTGPITVWEDDDGLVWIVLTTADRDWQPIPTEDHELPFHADSLAVRGVDLEKIFDTIIEVIDPSEHSVVARRILDPMISGYAGNSLLYGSRVTAAGDVAVDVWQVQLVRP